MDIFGSGAGNANTLQEPEVWNLEPGATYSGTGYQNTSIGTCCIKHNMNAVGGCSQESPESCCNSQPTDAPCVDGILEIPTQPSGEGAYPWSETIKWTSFGKPDNLHTAPLAVGTTDGFNNEYGGGWCFNVKSKQECFNLCSQMEGCNPTKEVSEEDKGDMTKWGLYEPDWVFVGPDREICPSKWGQYTCGGNSEGPWWTLFGGNHRHNRHDDNLEPFDFQSYGVVSPGTSEGDCGVFSRFKYYLKECMNHESIEGICTDNETLYQADWSDDPSDIRYCVCDMCDWYTNYFRPIQHFNDEVGTGAEGDGCDNSFSGKCVSWTSGVAEIAPKLPDTVTCHSYKQVESSDYNPETNLDCGQSPLKNLSSNINEIHRLKNEFKTESVSEYVLLPSGDCEWMTCGTERCPYPPCP